MLISVHVGNSEDILSFAGVNGIHVGSAVTILRTLPLPVSNTTNNHTNTHTVTIASTHSTPYIGLTSDEDLNTWYVTDTSLVKELVDSIEMAVGQEVAWRHIDNTPIKPPPSSSYTRQPHHTANGSDNDHTAVDYNAAITSSEVELLQSEVIEEEEDAYSVFSPRVARIDRSYTHADTTHLPPHLVPHFIPHLPSPAEPAPAPQSSKHKTPSSSVREAGGVQLDQGTPRRPAHPSTASMVESCTTPRDRSSTTAHANTEHTLLYTTTSNTRTNTNTTLTPLPSSSSSYMAALMSGSISSHRPPTTTTDLTMEPKLESHTLQVTATAAATTAAVVEEEEDEVKGKLPSYAIISEYDD